MKFPSLQHLALAAVLALPLGASAQNQDSLHIKKIYDEALTNGKSYEQLRYLTSRIGGRLSGSPQAAAAVEWARQEMEKLGLDRVYLQEVMVPHWQRGEKEEAYIVNSKISPTQQVKVIALGGSVPTPAQGLTAEVLEVKSIEELQKLGKRKVQGKIVFFSRPFDQTHIHTGLAYRGAVDQRSQGPSAAARLGAVGVVVRSMSSALDDEPHTGGLRYAEDAPKIPAVAISTIGAELLGKLLKDDQDLKLHLKVNSKWLPDVLSYNVIGEIKGSEKPEEIIVVGGHLDSWDNGQGAHDDGTGCVQSMEVLRMMRAMNYKPKRTIRAVMYMNEENGLRGGTTYAQEAKAKNEKHIAALESDGGGFTPRGFSMDATPAVYQKIVSWKPLLAPYGLHEITQDGGGADVTPLKANGAAVMEFVPDSQRYFEIHHTAADTFDKVNQRELELGGASMAALIYLMDKYGL
ncbi:M20/M25/M40 family metallo-hydrolase [Nibribacter ruber]|uniref:Carboxypeptidase Q n=1 Tax=Nibribacter ruber TaxID=2698458 RepID=A0A6P1P3H8_9BACT|nr:M28 family peptidase [Nibribacter ruber]QHL88915.1 M20/M25/M40 family metallo-hydrolase [Nibribacter ruber]